MATIQEMIEAMEARSRTPARPRQPEPKPEPKPEPEPDPEPEWPRQGWTRAPGETPLVVLDDVYEIVGTVRIRQRTCSEKDAHLLLQRLRSQTGRMVRYVQQRFGLEAAFEWDEPRRVGSETRRLYE